MDLTASSSRELRDRQAHGPHISVFQPPPNAGHDAEEDDNGAQRDRTAANRMHHAPESRLKRISCFMRRRRSRLRCVFAERLTAIRTVSSWTVIQVHRAAGFGRAPLGLAEAQSPETVLHERLFARAPVLPRAGGLTLDLLHTWSIECGGRRCSHLRRQPARVATINPTIFALVPYVLRDAQLRRRGHSAHAPLDPVRCERLSTAATAAGRQRRTWWDPDVAAESARFGRRVPTHSETSSLNCSA